MTEVTQANNGNQMINDDKVSQNPDSTIFKNTHLMREADEALQESNRRHVKPVIEENKLGIELFVGNIKNQYHGLVKARYADFIVHEIDLEGQLAELTILEPPEEEEPNITMKLEDLFDRKVLVCLSNVNSGALESYKIDVTEMDKEMRTSIHQAIRASYDKLESATTCETKRDKKVLNGDIKETGDQQVDNAEEEPSPQAEEEKKFIVVTRRNKSTRPRSIWPQNRPDYTHFILYKENKDTMEAIHNLSGATNSRPSNFGYAGTKDRRAVTTQWVSAWRLEPKRLVSAIRRYNRRPCIKVGNFCFKKHPIKLGQLKANRFDLVIRHLVHNSEGLKVIEEAMDVVNQRGFINYFGLQRFGTRFVQTHEIGLAILQGNWERATDLILSHRYDESAQMNVSQGTNEIPDDKSIDTTRAKETQNRPNKRWASEAGQHNAFIDMWKTKMDADMLFKRYPNFRMTNEGMLIKSLSKSGGTNRDYSTAVSSLPRNVRSMYVHSYQSLLWNKLVTFRLRKYGFNVVPGDLILKHNANISDLDVHLEMTEDQDESISNRSDNRDQCNQERLPLDKIESEIIVVTEDNLNQFEIFDVVLPLIGSRAKLPENATKEEIERLLGADGLSIESFRAREAAFLCYGSYRKIIVKPNNLKWSIEQYSNPYENIVETDLDRLNRQTIQPIDDKKICPNQGQDPSNRDANSDEALVVSFELPSSSYATMCLREIMKKPSTEFNNRF